MSMQYVAQHRVAANTAEIAAISRKPAAPGGAEGKRGRRSNRDGAANLPAAAKLAVRESEVTFHVAASPHDRLSAFHLVYRRYREAGLIESNPFKIRVTPFHLEPTTTVFVGRDEHVVHCTVTLVQDGCLGLPMETIFPAEVSEWRSQGLSLAEVSCLSFRGGLSCSESWSLFLGLNRMLAQFARHQGVDALLIAIHPRHLPVYQRMMGFVQIGSSRTYPSVCNNPAVACSLEFDRVDQNHPPAWEAIFGKPVPACQLDAGPAASHAERRHLREASDSGVYTFLPLAVA
jgi:hypothetical protein